MSHPSFPRCYALPAAAAALTLCALTSHATVRSSVFDDVKVWYKGSAGNAAGTSDANIPPWANSSSDNYFNKMKNLAAFSTADMSSGTAGWHDAAHGGKYQWWGWRLQYANQNVDCPYAGVSLANTPCMVVPETTYDYGTGTAEVEINGETTTQPYYLGARFGSLRFENWMSDWATSTVCSNHTTVLRFRSEIINHVSGNPSRVIAVGTVYSGTTGAATGYSLQLNTPVALGDYACPRIWVGTVQKNYTDIQIKSGRWVDCAVCVNGNTLTSWFCWNDGTDETPSYRLVKKTETYTAGLPAIKGGCTVQFASAPDTYRASFTNGVESADMSGVRVFRGAFHQVAFWDRTLSDDEIREAMAGGTGRPNLISVGMEGNGVEEFSTSSHATSVANTGAWEYLNPTLFESNPSATISFTCPAIWAGQSQWLRLPVASGSGTVTATINGTPVGGCNISAGGIGHIYVPTNVIVSGANTLVLSRNAGTFSLDAVRLGGSWRFGESINSFANAPATVDKYLFHPACGNDKFHDRTLNSSGDTLTQFRFFVPEDMVGKFRGVFTTRAQNTGGSTFNWEFLANGTSLGTYGLKGGNEYEIKVPVGNIIAGWNTLAWKRVSGWVNYDWQKFTLLPAPAPFVVVVR